MTVLCTIDDDFELAYDTNSAITIVYRPID